MNPLSFTGRRHALKLLAAGASDGLVPGDQVTLQMETGMDANGVPLPPGAVAVLQTKEVVAVLLVSIGRDVGLDREERRQHPADAGCDGASRGSAHQRRRCRYKGHRRPIGHRAQCRGATGQQPSSKWLSKHYGWHQFRNW